jgi:ATP-dependent DNA helicase
LEFLLSRASEYSNFIANDLNELQTSMSEQAQLEQNKGAKKRTKAEEKATATTKGSSKKHKLNNGSQKKQQQAVPDAAIKNTGTAKPIIQPPNLSTDCFLKDYQLEGVRWLASLYENGVSGILADGTSTVPASPHF